MPKGVPKDRAPRVGFLRRADHTAPADAEANVSAVVVSFEASTQELGPLLDAANRLMSQASCHIDSSRHRYTCRLVPKFADLTGDALRAIFLDLVRECRSDEATSVG